MDDARLAQIEHLLDASDLGDRFVNLNGLARDLLAEVRRLRSRLRTDARMDEQRLAQIEAYARVMCVRGPSLLAEDMVPELIAEIRRLRAELKTEYELNDQACRDGVESGHDDIADIIGKGTWNGDPDAVILAQIKSFLCMD